MHRGNNVGVRLMVGAVRLLLQKRPQISVCHLLRSRRLGRRSGDVRRMSGSGVSIVLLLLGAERCGGDQLRGVGRVTVLLLRGSGN